MCVAKETDVVPCLANSAATGDRKTIVESRLSINSSLTYNRMNSFHTVPIPARVCG